ncbi:response regulator [Candidatus Uabimicrobium sp. HlEnr_7]|uniref:response regulator n=1 Tax=Candidatus Uabimicrobium helgolandensis TaxID=3095367 RepID=UPI0035583B84
MSNNKVLVVDDDPDIVGLLEVIFTSMGWDVITAKTGKEAKELHSNYNKKICVIVLDVQMPEFDGFMFLEWLRNERKSQVPVILSTGLSIDQVGHKANEYSDIEVLNKPYTMQQLVMKLKKWKV